MNGAWVVCKRQLYSLLSNPMGYVFILVFVFAVNACCFIPDQFYRRNIADLAMLEAVMPWLLAVLIASIAMNAWSSEKEQGTEELLLTLPLRISDAVFGKFLAIVLFFSLALLCSGSSVCVLWYLGDPDFGLLISNYIGWWCMGTAFAALSLAMSVCASNQALSFVAAIAVNSVAILSAFALDWGEAFNRGMFSLKDLGLSVAFIVIGLAISLSVLASRRWIASERGERFWQLLACVAAIICAVNVSRMAERWNWYVDMTSAGLSSLSDAGRHIISDIQEPVTLHVVISASVPDELRVRSREVLDMTQALKKAMGSTLTVQIHRPSDPLTSDGRYVQEQYKVEPRQVDTQTVAGRQSMSIFLGAFIQGSTEQQSIPYFERGLSIEYELVRALRHVAQDDAAKRRIIGVVSTEIEMLEHFSPLTGEMKKAWDFVSELRKQYEVREVNPDLPLDDALDAIVVPMPSGLTPEQLQHVYTYMSNGGRALILADPMPILLLEEYQRYGVAIAPSLPRYDRFAKDAESAITEKCQIQDLWQALGIQLPLDQVAWSVFKPDASLPELPQEFVWLRQDVGSFPDAPIMHGIDTMMGIYPGMIRPLPGTALDVQTLISLAPDAAWGSNPFSDYLKGTAKRYQFNRNIIRVKSNDPKPALAVSITGALPSALGSDAASVKRSDQQAQVIVISDLDLAHDRFFSMAKRMNIEESSDFQKIWASIRNVQFLANAVDTLVGDQDLLALRSRHARYRSLTRLDAVRQETRSQKLAVKDQLEQEVRAEQQSAEETFAKKVAAILERKDLDQHSKQNQVTVLEREKQVYLQRFADHHNKALHKALDAAEIEERRNISTYQNVLAYLAIGIPCAFLLFLSLWVMAQKRLRERSDIPGSRLRAHS